MRTKLLILIFLPFISYPDNSKKASVSSDKQGIKPEKPKKNGIGMEEPLEKWVWETEFWDSLRVVPVIFMGKENDILLAQFSSRQVVQQINFKIIPEKVHSFSKLDGEWEQEIDNKEFLKRMKDHFWMVTYFSGEENIIFEAHQFKNWDGINAAYGSDPNQISKSPETFTYWTRARIKMVYFYNIQDDDAHWIFLAPTTDPYDPADDEILELENHVKYPRRMKSADGPDLVILENDTFTIDKNCVFGTIAVKRSKLKIPNIPFVVNNVPKTRGQSVSKDYFINNIKNSFWICIYEKDSHKLLRAIERHVVELNDNE